MENSIDNMITLKNIQKVIDNRILLDLGDIQIKPGQIAAFVGPEDSGKDLLLTLLLGRARPTLGKLRIMDIDPAADKNIYRQMAGILFEEDGLYERQSLIEYLQFFCQIHGANSSRAYEVLELIGLGDQAQVKIKKLNSGMKRRLAFGRLLLQDAKVYLMCEPFARCDQASISMLSGLIQQKAKEGAAFLLLNSDTSYLMEICDLIYTLANGRIINTWKKDAEQSNAVLPFKIPVRMEGRVILLNPADILFAEAEDGKVFINTLESRLAAQFTLNELENRLRHSGFFRAHRAYLVNLQHVNEVIPYTRDSYSLRLGNAGSMEIPLSKTSAAELKEILGY